MKLKNAFLVSIYTKILNYELLGYVKCKKNVLSGKFRGLQGLLTAVPLSRGSLFIKLTKEV